MDGKTLAEARVARDKALVRFDALPSLAGIGITSIGSGYGVKLNLSEAPGPQTSLPDHIEGVPLVVDVVGRISKQVA